MVPSARATRRLRAARAAKGAARKLREAGCTEQEIMDVTGHTTSRMVAKYTKGADRKKGAKAAIDKLENAK